MWLVRDKQQWRSKAGLESKIAKAAVLCEQRARQHPSRVLRSFRQGILPGICSYETLLC